MVTLNDIRPIWIIARFFGCGLEIVGNDNIMIVKYSIFYTIFFLLLYISICLSNFYVIMRENALESRLIILTIARTCLTYICVLSDIALTFKYSWKIRAAFSQLRVFDRTTNHKVHESSMHYVGWILSLIVFLFWSTAGYLTYYCESRNNLFNSLTYAFINTTLSMQVLRFASLTLLLLGKFRRLCEILLLPEDGKIMVQDRSSNQLRLQEVWWLHSLLSNAAEMVNSTYAIQLLLWISSMSFNTLTRIYTISDQKTLPIFLTAREAMMVSACSINLLIVTAVCHSLASQANRVGKIAFSPSSAIVTKHNFTQDCNMEAATYFQLHQVHFYAASGLIRIDLPLLLSIASGITTYLVILHTANSG